MPSRHQKDLASVNRILVLLITVGLLPACSPSQNTDAAAQQNVEPGIAQRLSEQNESSTTAVIKTLKANLRDKPSRSGAVVRTVEKDNRLDLISRKPVGPWYRVRDNRTGSEGWIHGNVIALTRTEPNAATKGLQQRTETTPKPSAVTQAPSGRSYINVDGVRVSSPVFSSSRPAGASARCRDGSYSFSRNRRGTCSHHGGVAVWF